MSDTAILCVDDEVMVTSAIRTVLEHHLKEVTFIETAQSAEEALEVVEDFHQDGIELQVVIADYIMPNMRGDDLLVELHDRLPRTKKIMLTGQSDVAGVKRAINEAGLYRFLEKPWHNDDLLLTLRGAIHAYTTEGELARQNEALRRLNEELEVKVEARTRELAERNRELARLSSTDRLTGLCNRLKLDEGLEEALAHARRYATPFSLVLIDVDHFKQVNDTHGHQVGDTTLVEVAGLLRDHVRETDLVGRWGGEEFLVVCTETERGGGVDTAEQLRRAIELHDFPVIGRKTASFGVSEYRDGDGIEAMVARADAALYRAKSGGRNRVESA